MIPVDIKEYLQTHKGSRESIADKFNVDEEVVRAYRRILKEESRPKESDIKRGIAIGDQHYPYQSIEGMNIVEQFTKDFKPDYFLYMGDQLDMDSISHYNKNKPKLVENKRLKKDYKGFQKDILNRFEDVLSDECELFWIQGNHENRCERLIEGSPQYEGWVEPVNNLKLDEYKYIDYNGVFNIGEMYFMHGMFHNKYHAEKNIRIYGKHIFTWHLHSMQIYTMHSPIDCLPKQGVSVPCLCTLNPAWLQNKPNRWVNGFLYFYLFPDGTFSYYIPIIVGGKCVINGKLYVG